MNSSVSACSEGMIRLKKASTSVASSLRDFSKSKTTSSGSTTIGSYRTLLRPLVSSISALSPFGHTTKGQNSIGMSESALEANLTAAFDCRPDPTKSSRRTSPFILFLATYSLILLSSPRRASDRQSGRTSLLFSPLTLRKELIRRLSDTGHIHSSSAYVRILLSICGENGSRLFESSIHRAIAPLYVDRKRASNSRRPT